MEEARDGTLKEKPLPDKMDLVRESTRVSISDWTESRERSVTSRQEVEREVESEASVPGFLEVVLTESASCLRDSRMVVSGFRRFWKGRDFEDKWGVLMVGVSSSVSESGRRRFLLSAI